MSTVPLGQREDTHLEFKHADVLQHPESVAREVVGMLNAEGGDVWIGVEEDNGYGVRVTPVNDAEGERGRVFDHLVDTIEPTPNGSDVTVEVVADEAGDVLVVRVKPGPRKPYAQLKGDGRRYVQRVDDRLRPMSRDDLRGLFAAESKLDDTLEIARRSLREARNRRQEQSRPGLWLLIRPVAELSLELGSVELRDILVNTRATGNREDGWACVGPWAAPRLADDALVLDAGVFVTGVHESGQLRIELSMERLAWREERSIWPFALLEHIVSAFRLARVLYDGRVRADEPILADFAIFDLRGWILRPYSPDAAGHHIGGRAGPIERFEKKDLLPTKLFDKTTYTTLAENPDGAAWPIIQYVYQSFGYPRPEAIPREFNAQTRRLMLGQ